MPSQPIKGDHTLPLASRSTADLARSRPTTSGGPQTPLRKTPSPKPPSPTTTPKPPSPVPSNRRTPTPPPPPELTKGRASPSRAFGSSSARASERTSPTASSKGGSGGGSPITEVSKVYSSIGRPLPRSTSGTPTPAPPSSHHAHSPSPARPHLPTRPKSVASEPSRVGAEARRPDLDKRRAMVPVETCNAMTQTDAPPEGVDGWDGSLLECSYHDGGEFAAEPTQSGVGLSVAAAGGEREQSFLNRPLQIMADLEMALGSGLEMLSEHHMRRPSFFGRTLPPALKQRMPHASAEGSDGEDGHGEDAEVKSLSLSEDGPVLRRSVSAPFFTRTVHAPDPFAMLSDGDHTVTDHHAAHHSFNERSIGGRGEPMLFRDELPWHEDREREDLPEKESGLGELGDDIDGEPLGSDRSVPNDSDTSAAPTYPFVGEADDASGCAPKGGTCTSADEQAWVNDLIKETKLLPILERFSSHQTAQAPVRRPGAPKSSHPPSVRSRMVRRDGEASRDAEYKRVPAHRARSEGSSSHIADLAQLGRLPSGERAAGEGLSPRDLDKTSQFSFGSANSAFSPPSSMLSPSSSSSQLASPRPRVLASSQSTPSLSATGAKR
mmetsp:Transcript_4968/g.13150  ORF Transcript_4968/g.13150 Transcript_4968/m.13150 type:complete len:608 (+) Transcript_4968:57-1880(+)